jgi:hypothetical protein
VVISNLDPPGMDVSEWSIHTLVVPWHQQLGLCRRAGLCSPGGPDNSAAWSVVAQQWPEMEVASPAGLPGRQARLVTGRSQSVPGSRLITTSLMPGPSLAATVGSAVGFGFSNGLA